jgi:hypothetical protein
MAYAAPSLNTTQATAAPWPTTHPKLNFTNVPFTTTSSMSTPTPISISQYAPPPNPTIQPILPITQNSQSDCQPQPATYGPTPTDDTLHSFHTSPSIRSPALSALTPPTYSLAFRGANASYVGTTYLGHYELESYDTRECARRCDGLGVNGGTASPRDPSILPTRSADQDARTTISAPATTQSPPPQICNGFNIYFERSPTIHLGPKCKDAPSRTIIKCALWGEGVRKEGATNTGYREWDFELGVAGSNGYRLGKEDEKGKKSEGGRKVALGGGLVKKVSMAVVVGWLVLMGMEI